MSMRELASLGCEGKPFRPYLASAWFGKICSVEISLNSTFFLIASAASGERSFATIDPKFGISLQ